MGCTLLIGFVWERGCASKCSRGVDRLIGNTYNYHNAMLGNSDVIIQVEMEVSGLAVSVNQ